MLESFIRDCVSLCVSRRGSLFGLFDPSTLHLRCRRWHLSPITCRSCDFVLPSLSLHIERTVALQVNRLEAFYPPQALQTVFNKIDRVDFK